MRYIEKSRKQEKTGLPPTKCRTIEELLKVFNEAGLYEKYGEYNWYKCSKSSKIKFSFYYNQGSLPYYPKEDVDTAGVDTVEIICDMNYESMTTSVGDSMIRQIGVHPNGIVFSFKNSDIPLRIYPA